MERTTGKEHYQVRHGRQSKKFQSRDGEFFHPNRREVIRVASERVKLQMDIGNFVAAKLVIDEVEQELSGATLRIYDPVASLGFESRLLSWLESHGFHTVEDLAVVTEDELMERPRFQTSWLSPIREALQRLKVKRT